MPVLMNLGSTLNSHRAKPKMPLAEAIIPLGNQGRRNWITVSDAWVVSFAKGFIEEKKIGGRKELAKADSGLYYALLGRERERPGIMENVGFERKRRDWGSMEDEEIVAHARAFMKERGIATRKELAKADEGLYRTLGKRKLLGSVGLEEKYSNWASLSDDELVGFAKRFIEENGIGGRRDLNKADSGLYSVLWSRKLLDTVFSSFELENQTSALTEIIDSVREFGGAE